MVFLCSLQLNPKDLNNNLLNENTTRGIQHQIETALDVFRSENLKSVDDQWATLQQQHGDIVDLQQDLAVLEARVQGLENGRGEHGCRVWDGGQPLGLNLTETIVKFQVVHSYCCLSLGPFDSVISTETLVKINGAGSGTVHGETVLNLILHIDLSCLRFNTSAGQISVPFCDILFSTGPFLTACH